MPRNVCLVLTCKIDQGRQKELKTHMSGCCSGTHSRVAESLRDLSELISLCAVRQYILSIEFASDE